MIKMQHTPEGFFCPDFSRVILHENGDTEYVINRNLSFLMVNLFMLKEAEEVYLNLKEVILKTKLFEENTKGVERKIKLFAGYREDKVNRYFSGESKSIFFDVDQIFKLDDLFSSYRFLCDADILYKGEVVEINKLSEAMQAQVVETMNDLGFVYDLRPEEYRSFFSIKRVKTIVKRKDYEKGGKVVMRKNQLILKGVGGSILIAIGSAILLVGVTVVQKSASTLLGIDKEIILIENDEEA